MFKEHNSMLLHVNDTRHVKEDTKVSRFSLDLAKNGCITRRPKYL
jgi:hypothetical protein